MSRREFDRLLDALFIDDLSPEDGRRVDELLVNDDEFRRRYVATQLLRADLEWDAVSPPPALGDDVPALAPRPAGRLLRFLRRRTPFSISVAAVVICVLLAAMAFMTPPIYRAVTGGGEAPRELAPQVVAQLTGVHEAQWKAGPAGVLLLAGQRLELAQGLAELTFRSGARATLEGPAVLTLDGENAATLEAGRLTAVVEDSPSGFTIHTRLTSVVDLGTEFGVSVEGGDVRVHVFRGEVALEPSEYVDGRRVMAAGQSATIRAADGANISRHSDGQQFVRALPWRPYGGVFNVAAARHGGRVSSCSPLYQGSYAARAIDQFERQDPATAYRWAHGDLYHSATDADGNYFEVRFAREYVLQRIEIQGRVDYGPEEHLRHQNLNIELFDSDYHEVWDYVDAVGEPYSGVTTQYDTPPSFGEIDLTDDGLALSDRQRSAKFLRITQTKPQYLGLAEVRAIGAIAVAADDRNDDSATKINDGKQPTGRP